MHFQCPHCHNPIELLDDAKLEEILCPSCGSSFNLVGPDTTESYHPGVQVLGRFELLEQLGTGRFGTVWKAHDTELDRFVAIKIPRQSQLTSEEVEAFFREARAAAQLRHPNLVAIHEVGRADEQIYIVSEYIQGANLDEWLNTKEPSSREAAQLLMKLADAIHHAHEAGIIHRDLKPANIMMDLTDEPHATDFGLAKRETGEVTITLDGQILGTPAYMSPEQAAGKAHQADARSDVYSLGVIMYKLLTGELPFRGEKRMQIVQILQDEPQSPRRLNLTIPIDLETICLKCLEKLPDRRYATARDLADDLRRFLNHEPIHARPISQQERLRRWCKRNPLAAALGIINMIIAPLTSLTVIAAASFAIWNDAWKTEWNSVDEQTRVMLAYDLAVRDYIAEHVRPEMAKRIGTDEFVKEVMSTSYVARNVFERVRKEFPDYVLKLSSENPRTESNRAGPGESKVLQYFREYPDMKVWQGVLEINGWGVLCKEPSDAD